MSPQVASSPPVDRALDSLHPVFREPLVAWLREAQSRVKHVTFKVTETRRTVERQRWLYAQGRTPPYQSSPVVTWTLDSRHRWGLAADLAMIRNDTGQPIWEISSWSWLYRFVPPQEFGLRHLGPREWVHLEYWLADAAIAEAASLRLIQT